MIEEQIQQQLGDMTFQERDSSNSSNDHTSNNQHINSSAIRSSQPIRDGSLKKRPDQNNPQMISIEDFSRIAPNLKALQELCSNQGFYVPKEASMKWLIRKYIEQKLPLSDLIKRCPPHFKLTKQICIEIINNHCSQIEPELRHDLQQLRDVAYATSQGQDPNFSLNPPSRKANDTSSKIGAQIKFKIPMNIDASIIQRLQNNYKPERFTTSKYINQLKDY